MQEIGDSGGDRLRHDRWALLGQLCQRQRSTLFKQFEEIRLQRWVRLLACLPDIRNQMSPVSNQLLMRRKVNIRNNAALMTVVVAPALDFLPVRGHPPTIFGRS